MKEHLRAIAEFARQALAAERLTPAGRINLLGMFGLFLLMSGGMIGSLAEPIGRFFNDDYRAGSPSLIAVALTFGGLMLACVLIVGLLDNGRDR